MKESKRTLESATRLSRLMCLSLSAVLWTRCEGGANRTVKSRREQRAARTANKRANSVNCTWTKEELRDARGDE